MFSTDLIPFAWSFGRVLAESWAGQLRWVKIGWYELSSARREGRRGRSLCVTNFPPVKPHLRPSSTLRTPTVIPNNKDHPPCHHHPHPRYDWITSFLSKTLTCCLWAKGWGWNSMLFFSVHFFISLFVVEFTALWSFNIFVSFFIFEVLVCLFLQIIFLGPPFPDRAHLSRTTRQTSANWNLVKWSLGAWECRI